MPIHTPALEERGRWIYQAKSMPTGLYFRLAAVLLMDLRSTSGSFSAGNTVQGGTSADTATIHDVISLDDGRTRLILKAFDESTTFDPGETVTDQNEDSNGGGSGTLDNAILSLLNQSGGPFWFNEAIEIGGTEVGKVQRIGSNLITIQEAQAGSIAEGDTITGVESGASADINKFYACEPGMPKVYGISEVVGNGGIGEPSANGYAPPFYTFGTTDFPDGNVVQTADGDYEFTTVQDQFAADDNTGGYGPFNVGFLSDQQHEATFDYSSLSGTFDAGSDDIDQGEQVSGDTSGATAYIHKDNGSSQMEVRGVNGTFSDGEGITGQSSGATATLDSRTFALLYNSAALRNGVPPRFLNAGETINVQATVVEASFGV